jgi:hypothetical protein
VKVVRKPSVKKPALVSLEGTKSWYLYDQLHHVDGPAVIYLDGREEWYLYGQLHRVDGPAMVRADGRQEWWQNGYLHRLDGPAVIKADGTVSWWFQGQQERFKKVRGRSNSLYKTLIINAAIEAMGGDVQRKDVKKISFSQIESFVYVFNNWEKERWER